ncbi:Putative membrane protein igaA homolog [Kluyvera cryocrescens]|uniref:Membrane protein igaA homolog n=1 Tax=Kluyvera cryocrescens TaxID=580 RepID=A0A485AR56_KLUCR|nr:Putative membrane protein igaA homolog [Kluyvera cryocrescens]
MISIFDRHVVRQGRFSSPCTMEVKNFPLQHWLRSMVIACGALLVVIMLWVSVPLNMPFKFTLSWLKGAQTIEASDRPPVSEGGHSRR